MENPQEPPLSLDELQQTVDRWIQTIGVRYFSELTVDLDSAMRANLLKKTQRDIDRHRENPKLQGP